MGREMLVTRMFTTIFDGNSKLASENKGFLNASIYNAIINREPQNVENSTSILCR